ncbi:hypothetical protein KsCSTR_32520 [Candidatus Kuenenia stuttgartiensis]|uniref:Uncharacterized protein n=1 Tax=Kuenenia stuttgartiensis TaxID=174633 RepID=Q1Q4N0_KUEST|nr:hypothetical protein KsCSTR_32520 [Candidatus Kuenenia stuttgartiensis]CAJ74975.1 unknown protein [Candidatus Kuenenia stuttgartiensis]
MLIPLTLNRICLPKGSESFQCNCVPKPELGNERFCFSKKLKCYKVLYYYKNINLLKSYN